VVVVVRALITRLRAQMAKSLFNRGLDTETIA